MINKEKLLSTCCGRKILSYLQAYGTGYDFCRFFINDSNSVFLLINSALLIANNNGHNTITAEDAMTAIDFKVLDNAIERFGNKESFG